MKLHIELITYLHMILRLRQEPLLKPNLSGSLPLQSICGQGIIEGNIPVVQLLEAMSQSQNGKIMGQLPSDILRKHPVFDRCRDHGLLARTDVPSRTSEKKLYRCYLR